MVRDLSARRAPATPEEVEAFEVDVLAGFVLARASAGLADSTICSDVAHLEQLRAWFVRPLWEMQPEDADAYFGRNLRGAAQGTRLAKAQALTTFFAYLELRHRADLYALTGHVAVCPLDEMNRPRGRSDIGLRVPPSTVEVTALFTGWRGDLLHCRKFAPTARNYVAARLMADLGLPINEVRRLDLADVRWDLGRFGKLHVRFGKGSAGSGPKQRMAPLINGTDRLLRWFIEEV